MYQYGWVQNWIFLDCPFMRDFRFFFFVLIQCKNMPKCQFLTWQKFCFSLSSNYSIWILKFKEAERNRRQEQDVLKSPFPPPHIDTWISFGKLSVFQCCCWNWNIGVLLFPCCCSPVGCISSGKAQSLHLNAGCNLLIPLKQGFLWILISAAFWGSWVILLIECLEVMEAAVLCRFWSILLTWGTVLWSFRVLCTVKELLELLTTTPELGGLWRQQKAAVPKMNKPPTPPNSSNGASAVLAAFL